MINNKSNDSDNKDKGGGHDNCDNDDCDNNDDNDISVDETTNHNNTLILPLNKS